MNNDPAIKYEILDEINYFCNCIKNPKYKRMVLLHILGYKNVEIAKCIIYPIKGYTI